MNDLLSVVARCLSLAAFPTGHLDQGTLFVHGRFASPFSFERSSS